MESQIWRQMSQMKSHEYDPCRFHSESQVDLTLRLGFPNGSGNGGERPDIDHTKPFFSTPLHGVNHHALQAHQVMVNNHGLASSGGRNGEMMSEANYNPHQIVWSKELKTYVLKSNNFGQLHSSLYSSGYQAKTIGSTANNMANLPLQSYNNDGQYTLLNPASRKTDDHEAEASTGGRRRGSQRRRVSACNEVERRCTNYNCNTNFTPMWRKGPLGPKSLCNACGIRYRKEMMNKEAMAAENSHG